MCYFDFSQLISDYSSEFKAQTFSEAVLNAAGDYVKGEKQETTLTGAIIAFRESKVHRSEGTLRTQDRRLFTLEPIKDSLLGSKVVYEGNVYSIENCTDNSKFTGCYAYTLRWSSAFKEGNE